MALCRNVSCQKNATRKGFFCSSCMEALTLFVDKNINSIKAKSEKFYIGRTNYPERRLLEHALESERTNLTVLHWAVDKDEIRYLEKFFIERHPDSENEDSESFGSAVGAFNALYVSWEEKSSKNIKGGEVEDLDAANRLWPEPFDSFEVITLFTVLTPSGIENVLGKESPDTLEKIKRRMARRG